MTASKWCSCPSFEHPDTIRLLSEQEYHSSKLPTTLEGLQPGTKVRAATHLARSYYMSPTGVSIPCDPPLMVHPGAIGHVTRRICHGDDEELHHVWVDFGEGQLDVWPPCLLIDDRELDEHIDELQTILDET